MGRFALRIRIVLLKGEILRIVSMAQVVTRRVGEGVIYLWALLQ